MSLLTTSLVDMLKPSKEKKILFYDSFVIEHTLISVSAIVSQVMLLPETYEVNDGGLDRDIDSLISDLPQSSLKLRRDMKAYYLGGNIDIGVLIQDNEEREFISNLFTSEANKLKISNRELVLRSLNASTFLNYFFLFENSIKKIYIEEYQTNPDEFLRSKDLISKLLRKKLKKDNTHSLFYEQLYKRTKTLISEKNLNSLWGVLNFIRNQQAHSNGKFDTKAQDILESKIEEYCASYKDEESKDNTLAIKMLLHVLEEILEQVKENGYITFNNSIENLIKNISIMVMESLYHCEPMK
ncbi:hypothetical protein ABHY64_000140 [Yersinia enterocolitica]|uniref:Uncharacterized protein n=1 Tax=Yersinia mollaretii TaxID=33060 RepID=A0AA36PIN8_YERMO|nr:MULTISPECIES: hypothetical protein [Yersinia]ELI8002943.1 hypothetical protein [Yersinia enterocolitica]ELZ9066477.1 hypothetical protein [Yersinia enterocolitica]MBW5811337.1 hypothetical protein [Yersinia kristensenii]CNH77972.1 Uncharacterised protein [Yersinia mollaretii]